MLDPTRRALFAASCALASVLPPPSPPAIVLFLVSLTPPPTFPSLARASAHVRTPPFRSRRPHGVYTPEPCSQVPHVRVSIVYHNTWADNEWCVWRR